MASPVPFSVLDLVPICAGSDAGQALRNTVDLAQHAERWGFQRYWLAEHHNMPGVASSATAVIIGQVAARTSTLRVGAGGVMLPNHSPLVIAEQFGTLAAMYPGRIDLGLGRAPGTDLLTTQALRRDLKAASESFPDDVVELMGYFRPVQPGQPIRAIPGAGQQVPVWLLGSSLFSAQLAAMLGLPFAFAAHFAPGLLTEALHVYRAGFRPSPELEKPRVMLCVNVYAADTDGEARRLFTSLEQAFLALRTGRPGPLQPPRDGGPIVPAGMLDEVLRYSFVGAKDTVRKGLQKFLAETGADEVMATAMIYDHAARLHSYELLAEVRDSLG